MDLPQSFSRTRALRFSLALVLPLFLPSFLLTACEGGDPPTDIDDGGDAYADGSRVETDAAVGPLDRDAATPWDDAGASAEDASNTTASGCFAGSVEVAFDEAGIAAVGLVGRGDHWLALFQTANARYLAELSLDGAVRWQERISDNDYRGAYADLFPLDTYGDVVVVTDTHIERINVFTARGTFLRRYEPYAIPLRGMARHIDATVLTGVRTDARAFVRIRLDDTAPSGLAFQEQYIRLGEMPNERLATGESEILQVHAADGAPLTLRTMHFSGGVPFTTVAWLGGPDSVGYVGHEPGGSRWWIVGATRIPTTRFVTPELYAYDGGDALPVAMGLGPVAPDSPEAVDLHMGIQADLAMEREGAMVMAMTGDAGLERTDIRWGHPEVASSTRDDPMPLGATTMRSPRVDTLSWGDNSRVFGVLFGLDAGDTIYDETRLALRCVRAE